jgi:SP family general alpha glucoside:H+ symporter-like MFS transporter
MDHSKKHPSELLEFKTVPSYLAKAERVKSIESDCKRSIDESLPEVPSSPKLECLQSNHDLHYNLMASVPGFKELAKEAKEGTKAEHRMTLFEGLRLYPKAIGWSLLLSLTIVMEGFDITLVTSFFAFPAFKSRYGRRTVTGDYQISPSWQAGLTNGAVVGEIVGLFCNGILTDRFGNRKTMLIALSILVCCVFLTFFATGVQMLLFSQILSGLPWGVFQTLSTTYAAEVMPLALRPYLTSGVNLCWIIGQLISVCMLRALIHDPSQWSYRIPFALQWVWAVPILIAVTLCPESPWWLVQHEQPEKARRALLRLTSRTHNTSRIAVKPQVTSSSQSETKNHDVTSLDVDTTLGMMRHTNEVEKYLGNGTSFMDCLRGPDLRRTEIACMVWITQALCGVMIGNSVYFMEQAGLSSPLAFDLSIGMYSSGILGTFLSWILMRFCGRRTLYLWGCASCSTALIAAGVIGILGSEHAGAGWALASLIVATTFIYDATIGPVCYALVAEIPAARLRVKTVVLARVAYNLVTLVGNFLVAKMLNPTAWDWRGKTCLVWGILAALCFVWCFFRLPEPRGLTYMELDILFQKGAEARKFGKFRGRLAQTGYFSLCKGPESKDSIHEWSARLA